MQQRSRVLRHSHGQASLSSADQTGGFHRGDWLPDLQDQQDHPGGAQEGGHRPLRVHRPHYEGKYCRLIVNKDHVTWKLASDWSILLIIFSHPEGAA